MLATPLHHQQKQNHTLKNKPPQARAHTRLHAFCNSTSVPSPVATPAWTTCMGQALFSLMHREGTKAQGGQVILWQSCVSSIARAQAQVCLQFTSGQQSASAEGLQGGVFPWPGPHPCPPCVLCHPPGASSPGLGPAPHGADLPYLGLTATGRTVEGSGAQVRRR